LILIIRENKVFFATGRLSVYQELIVLKLIGFVQIATLSFDRIYYIPIRLGENHSEEE
jgi:hypothetical protein